MPTLPATAIGVIDAVIQKRIEPETRRQRPDRLFIIVTVIRRACIPAPRMEGLMPTRRATPRNIDEYIASFSPEVQAVLEKIRLTIRQAVPDVQETISYGIPAFTLDGILVYFAAFKKHIGLYPPVRGDAKLEKSISTWAGEKGNLQFPLDQPIPYHLIERIVKLRVKQNMSKARASQKT